MKKVLMILLVAGVLLFLVLDLLPVFAKQAEPEVSFPPEQTAELQETPEPPRKDYSREAASLTFSEAMVKNRSSIMSEDGSFNDWIELENTAAEPVDLEGWFLSDGKNTWTFPAVSIEGGEYLVIEAGGSDALSTSFRLSSGDSLALSDPNGDIVWTMSGFPVEADRVLALQADGSYLETSWPTPGFANTPAGYEAWCRSLRIPQSPLILSEVCNANNRKELFRGSGLCDWIELKNNSQSEILLSDYYLSDKNSDKKKFQLPDEKLAPGAYYLVACTDAESDGFASAPFSLGVPDEQLWLTHRDGTVVDALYLHDIPVDGSFGRMDGQSGGFYFTDPTPGEANSDGARRVAAPPQPSIPSSVYDDASLLTVSLSCEEGATIYYTTDCTIPTVENGKQYSGPISIEKTTVLRAITVKEGLCTSRVNTLSYILNGGHTLPVLSLVADQYMSFIGAYWGQEKGREFTGTLALYENGEEQFNNACGIRMKGWTSLHLPKKSLGVYFRGRYGDGDVKKDLFGNGVADYSSLSIRAGQDYTFAVVRNELFQTLCAECAPDVVTQNGKYCVLYLNGEYWGLYCLKENLNEQCFAALKNVDEDTVQTRSGQVDYDETGLRKAIEFTWLNDMADDANYEAFCKTFNISSLIDWIILEGYSGNSDTLGNIRYYRSPEYDGGRWQMCYYDLDWGFGFQFFAFRNILEGQGNAGFQIRQMSYELLKNRQFREAFLKRFSELIRTTLSNEHVLATFEELVSVVEPEIPREREKWDLTVSGFYHRLDEVRTFIVDNDYETYCIRTVCELLNVTPEEKAFYFGENSKP